MTFAAYWLRIETANPQVNESDAVRLTIHEFRKQLRNAYDAALADKRQAWRDDVLDREFLKDWFGLGSP